jgi:hypothetical protein
MNKVISDFLACKWDAHTEADIRDIDNPTLIHGFDYLVTTQPNPLQNKILSNQQGWLWDIHEDTNVYEYSLSGNTWGGQAYTKAPHDLWPVQILDTVDTKINKVVSNQMMAEIYALIALTKAGIFTISETGTPDAYWAAQPDGHHEAILTHNLGIPYPDVTCYGFVDGAWKLVKTAEVEYVDIHTLKIEIATDAVDMTVRVTT